MARTGERNKQTIYYANRTTDTMMTDTSGYYTGEHQLSHGTPVAYRIAVSEAKNRMDRLGSSTFIEPYGLELGYNKILTTSDLNCPIQDDSYLWVDTMPVFSEGVTNTPPDYIVVQKKKSLNNLLIAIKKVDVS